MSGASPVVDTTSTTATTQFTRETIELLPTSRNGIVSLLAQAPGVRTLRDVGGSSLNQVPTYRVFGQAGEAYSTLEGVQTSSLQAVERPGELLGLHGDRRGVGPHHRQQRRGAEPRRQPERDRQVRRQRVPQQRLGQQDARRASRATTSTTSWRGQASPAARRLDHALQHQRRPRRPHHPGQALVLWRGAPDVDDDAAAEHVHAGRLAGESPKSWPGSHTEKLSYQMSPVE